MKKKYSSDEILKMAVGLADGKYDADLNSDGNITAEDARIAKRNEQGLPDEQSAVSEKKLKELAAASVTGFGADSEKLYNYYKNKYTENASKAAENAYGLATGNTGGYGNTYAAAVSNLAYDSYMDGLFEEVSEANEKAYANALEFAEKSAGYGDYSYLKSMGIDTSDAQREKTMEAAVESAEYGDYSGLKYMGIDTSAAEKQSALEEAEALAKYGDYSGLEALGVDLSSVKNSEALENAVTLAKYGDYSGLEQLGVDISGLEYEDALNKAEASAKYGDYSGLENMGVNTDVRKYSDALEIAEAMAEYGDYSGLEKLGIDTSLLRYDKLIEIAVTMAEYGDYSGLEAIGVDTDGLKESEQLEKALALAKYGDYSLLGEFSENITSMKSKIGVTLQNGASAAYSAGGYRGLIKYLNTQIAYGQITEKEKKQIIGAITGNGGE